MKNIGASNDCLEKKSGIRGGRRAGSMDDATETDVLYEACSILMRLSARSIQSIRQDIDHIEIPIANLADQVESSSWTFLPLILVLFTIMFSYNCSLYKFFYDYRHYLVWAF